MGWGLEDLVEKRLGVFSLFSVMLMDTQGFGRLLFSKFVCWNTFFFVFLLLFLFLWVSVHSFS